LLIMWSDWVEFWKSFGLAVADVQLPPQRAGYDRLLVIPKGLTTEGAFQICRELFPCHKYVRDDLDQFVTTNSRAAQNGAYAIWVRQRIEADEEFKNKSACELQACGHIGITLLERLVYEAKYFKETGKHLDVENVTMCAGSRNCYGSVLGVDFNGICLNIDWFFVGTYHERLRSREVISV
jgi:hypothetical protein